MGLKSAFNMWRFTSVNFYIKWQKMKLLYPPPLPPWEKYPLEITVAEVTWSWHTGFSRKKMTSVSWLSAPCDPLLPTKAARGRVSAAPQPRGSRKCLKQEAKGRGPPPAGPLARTGSQVGAIPKYFFLRNNLSYFGYLIIIHSRFSSGVENRFPL